MTGRLWRPAQHWYRINLAMASHWYEDMINNTSVTRVDDVGVLCNTCWCNGVNTCWWCVVTGVDVGCNDHVKARMTTLSMGVDVTRVDVMVCCVNVFHVHVHVHVYVIYTFLGVDSGGKTRRFWGKTGLRVKKVDSGGKTVDSGGESMKDILLGVKKVDSGGNQEMYTPEHARTRQNTFLGESHHFHPQKRRKSSFSPP